MYIYAITSCIDQTKSDVDEWAYGRLYDRLNKNVWMNEWII